MSPDPRTTAELLVGNAERDADAVFAVFDDGERWTNAETLERAWAIAAGLADLGVEPGEPVLSWLPNGEEAVSLMLGANAAGAVYAPLNIAYRGEILEHAVNLVRAKVLVAHVGLLDRLQDLHLPELRRVVVVGGPPPQLAGLVTLGWNELVERESTAPEHRRARAVEDDMCFIFTSGTTGPSKAVRCSYLSHHAYSNWFRAGDLGAGDRALLSLPMFHVGGTGWLFTMLSWGGSIAVVPRFSTSTYWKSVRELGATTATIMAAMATFLMGEPERDEDADNPMRIALLVPGIPQAEDFAERFGIALWSGYAMTEVPGPLRTPLGAAFVGSAGVAMSADWDLRLVDEDGADVAQGEKGELLCRNRRESVITDGYVNMPEASEDAWRDGWFHTGDLFNQDAEGNFHFVDRNKDALRRRGENVSSFELERAIVGHPDVVEAAVVGVPAAESEDEILAFVVLRQDAELDPHDLFEFLAERLPHYMVPRYIEYVDGLPKTPTEKIRKVELRDRGVGPETWDSVAHGLVLKAVRLESS